MARREVHGLLRVHGEARGALEGEDVGRIGDDLRCAQRREHAPLIGERERGTRAERGDRRELDRLEALCRGEQVRVERDAGAQIVRPPARERVAPVLREDLARRARARPALHHLEQERLELGAREPRGKRFEHRLPHAVDDPSAVRHGTPAARLSA
jgi:hypothetical protein